MIEISSEKCKGCGICTEACPKKSIEIDEKELNSKGFHPAKIVGECTECGCCFIICPDCAVASR